MRSLLLDDVRYRTFFTKKYAEKKPYSPPNLKIIKAFIPGTIRAIYVKKGQKVKAQDKLLILEAMKMNNIILAHSDGVIKEVHVTVGSTVPNHGILVEFE
jgi:biotin carboxyl carrier protein